MIIIEDQRCLRIDSKVFMGKVKRKHRILNSALEEHFKNDLTDIKECLTMETSFLKILRTSYFALKNGKESIFNREEG